MTEKNKETLFDKVKKNLVDPYIDKNDDEDIPENTSEYEEPSNEAVANMNARMIINEPRSYEDARIIADYLLQKKACVVNIHRLQESGATRLLDFLSGTIYAINGTVQKIDDNVFLFAPKELPVGSSGNDD
ncbi:MAG: cell division protein SepF [Erysipelotrichaceae bacterium]|nr:cell division protein SepF [Erysipelotrichaceae bacterium]MBO4537241.1 cell division protein SepF [Erysipelotrichaceae bacterium]MBR5049246.1 cell division protein SepF [Erysipelotrichaceae bacterium]